MRTPRAENVPRAGDVVVFGAPGASFTNGKLWLSPDGQERAALAARYWLSYDQGPRPMRVICVAGRSGYRGGMAPLPPGQSEAAEMIHSMRAMGVPADVIRPNEQFPLRHDYSVSTVDEVAVLLEEGLIKPELYGAASPLAVVLHRRHGARAIDVLRKAGFGARQLYLLSPPRRDSFREILIRLAYRVLVLGGPKPLSASQLRQREERLMAMSERFRKFLRIF